MRAYSLALLNRASLLEISRLVLFSLLQKTQ